MFDAFSRFNNGIISHEASNQGGGSGGQPGYRGNGQAPASEDPKKADLHLDGDSLSLSATCKLSKLGLPEDSPNDHSGPHAA